MNKSLHHKFKRLFLPLFLVACSAGALQTVEAHPYSAKREFFHLKKSGEWVNYAESSLYVEVAGTKFIGLESAFSERRSCLFGFSQAGFESSGSFQVQSKFVCFKRNQYELTMKKEWCELGSSGCEIDPGGISVGIGNLDIAEPLPSDMELPLPKPGSFYKPYPRVLNLDVYQPRRFPTGSVEGILPDMGIDQ